MKDSNQKKVLVSIQAVCLLFTMFACQESENNITFTGLPSNISEKTIVSQATQASGLDPYELCQKMTYRFTDLFFSEKGQLLTCGISALSSSYFGPNDISISTCNEVYQGCMSSYSATVTCSTENIDEIARCQVSMGVWRDCIDQQMDVFEKLSKLKFSCTDLNNYYTAVDRILSTSNVQACQEIENKCPNLVSSDSNNDYSSSNDNDDYNDGSNQNYNEDDFGGFEDDFEDDFDFGF